MTISGTRGKLRAAVIGAGLMGRWHAAAVRHVGHPISAVYDADPLRAKRLANALGVPAVNSLDEAIEAADVVHVCSPLPTHAMIASRALAAGRSVVCEKPLAESPAEVRALHASAVGGGVLLVPTHQFLFQRGVQEALRALPTLGGLRHIDLIACTAGASGRDAAGTEAIAMDVLPHPLSLVERLLPGTLDQIRWSVAITPLGELRIAGTCGESSVGILISCSGRPPVNQLRIICTGGTVVADLFHGFATIDRGGTSRVGKITRPLTSACRTFTAASVNLARRGWRQESAYPGLRELIAATYRAAETGAEPPISAQESVAVADACAIVGRLRAGHAKGD